MLPFSSAQFFAGTLILGGFIVLFTGWLTHVIVTIQSVQWLLLIAGAIMAPIGIIHGWGLWFGAW